MSFEVIIIDDDPIVVFLHRSLVRQSKLSVDPKAFSGGRQALDYLDSDYHSNRPCLLLLDINMAPMDGWEFLEEISKRSYAKFVFIIVVSSSVETCDRKKAAEFKQVVAYLEKPIRVKDLLPFKLSARHFDLKNVIDPSS